MLWAWLPIAEICPWVSSKVLLKIDLLGPSAVVEQADVCSTLMGYPFLILLDKPSEGVAPVIVGTNGSYDHCP